MGMAAAKMVPESRTFAAGEHDRGGRLDVFLAERLPELSRSLARRLIDEGQVTVGGRVEKPSYKVQAGDQVEVELDLPPSLSAEPEPIDLNVVYEDEAICVVDKPAGLVVHPAPGHAGGTLVNALVHRYPSIAGGGLRPGIVHRLDKDTSGLMVVALTVAAQANLAAQIKRRTVRREYLALVSGHPADRPHVIDAPIGRDRHSRLKMAVGSDTIRPRRARTTFEVVEYIGGCALVRARLETGRTHQVRVHLALARHPVAGDRLYGGATLPGLERQFLHASLLELTSPVTEERQRFESQLPPDLASVLRRLREAR